ncbi:MAG: elongation factor G [Candidatus Sericytochromatia bacterium]|nr:elongation factor G [Candidatus Sericytochromatia bacterium]
MTEDSKKRNIAILGTFGSGKTTLVESLLHYLGAISQKGTIEAGTTVSDYDADEIRRHLSLGSSLCQVSTEDGWLFNFIDTPGFQDFLHESLDSLNVVESVILVLDPLKGLDITTQKLMAAIRERHLPCMLFVNKLDHDLADFETFAAQLEETPDFQNLYHLTLPIGHGHNLSGNVEVLEEEAWVTDESREGHAKEIPADVDVAQGLETLVEEVSEEDAHLLDTYLETGHLPVDEVRHVIHDSFKAGHRHLLLSGSGKTGAGLHSLVSALKYLAVHPEERGPVVCQDVENAEKTWEVDLTQEKLFSAYVFKTVTDPYLGKISLFRVFSGSLQNGQNVLNANGHNERIGKLMRMQGKKTEAVEELVAGDIGAVAKLAHTQTGDTLLATQLSGQTFVLYPLKKPEPIYAVAIAPKHRQDENKLANGLHKLKEEDPYFTLSVDPATHQSVLGGVGQAHVELLIERLASRYHVEVKLSEPRIPYRETITQMAEAQGKHKKQTGGHGQYGDVWLRLEPLPRGAGFVFETQIVGGVVPRNYWSAVEKGVQEILQEGILARQPITDLKVTLYDGSSHNVDSSDLAFQLAAKLAFRNAYEQAKPTLLEPIMQLEITVAEEQTGAILSDLGSRSGHPLGMELQRGVQVIQAELPMAEVLHYPPILTSLTHGQGSFSARFSHYAEMHELQKQQLKDQMRELVSQS